MAELGAVGDSQRGGDGAVRSETGDCTAGAGGGPAGRGRPAARVGSRRAPAVPSPARPRPGTAGPARRAPGLGTRLPSALRRASAAGPGGPQRGRPRFRSPPLRPGATFPQQVDTRQRARAGGGTAETLAAPLPPADSALIQLNGEIVSPKLNNQPENPLPGAADRIIRFWQPSRLPRSPRLPGSQAPLAQRSDGAGAAAAPARVSAVRTRSPADRGRGPRAGRWGLRVPESRTRRFVDMKGPPEFMFLFSPCTNPR